MRCGVEHWLRGASADRKMTSEWATPVWENGEQRWNFWNGVLAQGGFATALKQLAALILSCMQQRKRENRHTALGR